MKDPRGLLPAAGGLLVGMALAQRLLWPLELWLAARATRRANLKLDGLRDDFAAAR